MKTVKDKRGDLVTMSKKLLSSVVVERDELTAKWFFEAMSQMHLFLQLKGKYRFEQSNQKMSFIDSMKRRRDDETILDAKETADAIWVLKDFSHFLSSRVTDTTPIERIEHVIKVLRLNPLEQQDDIQAKEESSFETKPPVGLFPTTFPVFLKAITLMTDESEAIANAGISENDFVHLLLSCSLERAATSRIHLDLTKRDKQVLRIVLKEMEKFEVGTPIRNLFNTMSNSGAIEYLMKMLPEDVEQRRRTRRLLILTVLKNAYLTRELWGNRSNGIASTLSLFESNELEESLLSLDSFDQEDLKQELFSYGAFVNRSTGNERELKSVATILDELGAEKEKVWWMKLAPDWNTPILKTKKLKYASKDFFNLIGVLNSPKDNPFLLDLCEMSHREMSLIEMTVMKISKQSKSENETSVVEILTTEMDAVQKLINGMNKDASSKRSSLNEEEREILNRISNYINSSIQ